MKRSYHAFSGVLSIFLISTSTHAGNIQLQSVPDTKLKQGTIQQVLSGNSHEVWHTLMDIAHYNEFMPKNKKTVILEQDENHIRYRAHVDMPWPISDVQYDCDVYPMKDLNRIEFNMVEGSSKGVKNFYGHWELKKTSDKTMDAKYVLMFEPAKSYPQWAMNMGLKSTLGQVMKSVQGRINTVKQTQSASK